MSAETPDHTHALPRNASAAFRAHGRRLTHQREAIWQVLAAADGAHLTAEDIITRVFEDTPFVNLSTVYRTLQLLVDDGLVRRTELGDNQSRYELAHIHPHHHIVCDTCGTITHLHDDTLGELPRRIEKASGYTLNNTEITFHGRCRNCSQGLARAPSVALSKA